MPGRRGATQRSTIRRGLETLHDLDAPGPAPKSHRAEGAPALELHAGRAASFQGTSRDWDEWRAVYGDLFSTASDRVERGAAAVQKWRNASHARQAGALCPRYAPVTAQLALAIAYDNGRLPADVTVAVYCGTLARFVAEIVGVEASTKSYRARAKELLVPDEVTETRNLIAHGRAPPLAQLRWTAVLALQYARTAFWEPQMRELPAVEAVTATVEASAAVAKASALRSRVAAAMGEYRTEGDPPAGESLEALRARMARRRADSATVDGWC